MTTTMRALIRSSPAKSLTLATDLPRPSSDKFHHITIHATALTREELIWPEPQLSNPPIPGYDLAGTILATPRTSRFKPGDEVYALTSFNRQGNAREVSEALEEELALKPRNLSWEEAAAVPLSALSAWQGLFVHGGLAPPKKGAGLEEVARLNREKRVLVTAAAGGVGVWAVQLARLAGARVVGTCGSRNVEFVKGLGAGVVLDYSTTSLREWVYEDEDGRSFDLVLDCIGGNSLQDAWLCVKKNGIVVSVAQPPDSMKPQDGLRSGVKGVWFIVEPSGQQLEQITALIEDGKCEAIVDSVFRLEEWEKAFERLGGGHARGKVVLKRNDKGKL